MPKKKTKKEESVADFGVDTAKGGVIFTAASIIRAIGTLLLLIILARLLQPTDYGLYTIVVAFAALLGLNTDYGVGNALRKKLPESKAKDRILSIINNAYFGAMCAAAFIAIVGIVFSNYIAVNAYSNPALTVPIIIAFVSIIFSTFFTVTISVLLGLRKNKEAGIGYIVYSFTQLIFSTALILIGFGVNGALIGMLLSFVLGSIVCFFYLLKEIEYKLIKPTKKILVELFGFSTPIFTANALTQGTQYLGVVLLGIFSTAVIVGNFGAALKLGAFGGVIILSFSQILLPTYSHMISNKKLKSKLESVYNNSIYYSLLLLAPLLAYFISVSKPLIYLLLSNTYTLTPLYFSIIATGTILLIINRYGGQMIIGHGKVKTYTLYQIGGSAIMVILLVVLTPFFKAYGVLLSLFVIGPIVLDLVFIRFMRKELQIKIQMSRLVKIFTASIVLWLLLTYIVSLLNGRGLTILINAIVTLVVFPPLLALLNGINKEDTKFIEKVSDKLHVTFIMKYILKYTNIFIKN